MVKEELIAEIAKRTSFDKSDVRKMLEAFMSTTRITLSNGENLYLRGFGTWKVEKRAAKKVRNISKNYSFIIPEQMVAVFNPGKRLKSLMKKVEVKEKS